MINTIEEIGADIVFLQEVIPETFSYLESKLTGYECFAAKQENYFVATLIRRGRVYVDRHKVIDFETSRMYRHVLAVQVCIDQSEHSITCPCQIDICLVFTNQKQALQATRLY